MNTVREAQVRPWKPSDLPWRALKKGNADYTWYLIIDSAGNEIATVGGAHKMEGESLFNDVLLILTKVNESNIIQINDNKFEVEWGGESVKEG